MNVIPWLICAFVLNFAGMVQAEDEDSSAKVGPGQAVLEANAGWGVKLSSEAIKNLEIKTVVLQGAGPWLIKSAARLVTGEEVNLYRVRDNFFKRVDFVERKRQDQLIWITSPELRMGDEIVVSGVALLRISELAALGEAPSGHSH